MSQTIVASLCAQSDVWDLCCRNECCQGKGRPYYAESVYHYDRRIFLIYCYASKEDFE